MEEGRALILLTENELAYRGHLNSLEDTKMEIASIVEDYATGRVSEGELEISLVQLIINAR